MIDAYETSIAIAHNDMIRSLKHLGDIAGHGSGAIVEEIPAQEIRAMMLDPIEVVEAAAKQRGYSKAEFTIVRMHWKRPLVMRRLALPPGSHFGRMVNQSSFTGMVALCGPCGLPMVNLGNSYTAVLR